MAEVLTDDEKSFYQSVSRGHLAPLTKLLDENPHFVQKFRSDPYLWGDAFRNEATRQDIVKTLVEAGFDVNLSNKGILTPLLKAIAADCYEIAEYLLQHGADPNLDRPLIGAMNCDTESLRLPFVKLLVEHGADVNQLFELYSTGTYFTALDWASSPEIAAYLRAQGAKTSAELQGIDPERLAAARVELSRRSACRTELIAHFEEKFGPVDEVPLVETLPSGNSIELYFVRPEGDRKHFTVFTWGLSQVAMQVPAGEEKWAIAEVYLQLPGDWQVDQLQDDRWKWPLEWLAKIACYPRENQTWLGPGFTIISNGEPLEPLAPNTGMTCLMMYASHMLHRSDGQDVALYRVTPIYTEERDLERREGVPALMRAFDRHQTPFILDVNRPNAALN